MQTEVTLSATEAECIVLSQSAQDLILIKQINGFLNSRIKIDSKAINTFLTVFEDNNRVL